MAEAYIIDAIRTPVGKRGGGLAQAHPADLGAASLTALVERTEGGVERLRAAGEELKVTRRYYKLAADASLQGVLFLPKSKSPTRTDALIVTNEVSGTTTIYKINKSLRTQ